MADRVFLRSASAFPGSTISILSGGMTPSAGGANASVVSSHAVGEQGNASRQRERQLRSANTRFV
jgi:hypothetical protein